MAPRLPSLPLPRGWSRHVQTGLLHAVALGRLALMDVRAGFDSGPLARRQEAAELDRLRSRIAQLEEEIRIKDARMALIPANRRPHCTPELRLDILSLRAATGWSAAETASRFLVTRPTVAEWMGRLDRGGARALLQTRNPVNRFPDFMAELVQRLTASLPRMGRRRIADVLARAGVHLAASTVRRMLQRPVPKRPDPKAMASPHEPTATADEGTKLQRVVIARYPDHVWGADLSAMPLLPGGFWVPWLPFALPQCWPFAWWLLLVVDHYSRALVHVAVFRSNPTAEQVCTELSVALASPCATGPPKHMVTDQGSQFQDEYRRWCEAHRVKPRFGAIGKYGSIAVVERLIRTLKSEGLRRFLLPLRIDAMRTELALLARWYDEVRPHSRFAAATPDEIRRGVQPATERARFETRPNMPTTGSLLLRGKPGAVVDLRLSYLEGRRHLPVVGLRRVA